MRSWLLLCCLLLPTNICNADFVERFPASTLWYVDVSNVSQTKQRIDQTEFGKLRTAESTKDFSNKILNGMTDSTSRSLGFSFKPIQSAIAASDAFAIGSIALTETKAAPFVLISSTKRSEILAKLQEDLSGISKGGLRQREGELEVLAFTDLDKEKMSMFVVESNEALMLCTDMQALLMLTGKSGGRLIDTPGHLEIRKQCLAAVGGNVCDFYWFVAQERLLAIPNKDAVAPGRGKPTSMRSVFAELLRGTECCGGVTCATSADTEQTSYVFLYAKEPRVGVVSTIHTDDSAAANLRKLVPNNVDYVMEANIKMERLKSEIGGMIGGYYGIHDEIGVAEGKFFIKNNRGQRFYEDLKKLLREDPGFAIDIDADFFDALGDQLCGFNRLVVDDSRSREMSCMLIAAKDVKRITESLGKIARLKPGSRSPDRSDNVLLFPSEAEPPHRRTSALALVGDVVAIATDVELIDDVIALSKGDSAAKSVAEAPAFKKHNQLNAGEKSVSQLYGQTKSTFAAERNKFALGIPNSTSFAWIFESFGSEQLAAIEWPDMKDFESAFGPISVHMVNRPTGLLIAIRSYKSGGQ